jgi:hypothetical protein
MTNILAILHAIKMDLLNCLVSLFLGSSHGIGKADDAEYPTAIG